MSLKRACASGPSNSLIPSTLAVARRRAAGRAAAQARLHGARHGHRGRAEQAGDEALADARGHHPDAVHDASWSCSSRLLLVVAAPSRSIRWSPTRSAFAIAVSAGFTALDDGKKLVSTT